jgi:hypothetical protein
MVGSAHLYQGHVGCLCQYCIAFIGEQLYGPRHISDVCIPSVDFWAAVSTDHSTVSSSNSKNQVQRSPPLASYLYWLLVVPAHLVFEACRQDGQPVMDSSQIKTEQFCSFIKGRYVVGVSEMIDVNIAVAEPERGVGDKLGE